MQSKKEMRKRCEHCSKEISLKSDKYVRLSTINMPPFPDDHRFYHFKCFVDYWKDAVMKSATALNRFNSIGENMMSVFSSLYSDDNPEEKKVNTKSNDRRRRNGTKRRRSGTAPRRGKTQRAK